MIKDVLKKYKLIFIILMPIYIGVLLLTVLPSSYEITLTGGLTNIGSEIKIEGNTDNEVYSVYVISLNRSTVFQSLLARWSLGSSVEKKEDLPYKVKSSGALQKEISYTNALINAYEKASVYDNSILIDYEKKGFIVSYSIRDDIEVSDLFTHINGHDLLLLSEEDIHFLLKDQDAITVTFIRQGKTHSQTLLKEEGRFGLSLEPYYHILSSTPSYRTTFNINKTFGPSGGLMQSLYIYYHLLDLDYNGIIAGTGTISANGDVGEIGGVWQKVYTVYGKVDIFFVPNENYQEAKEAYDSLNSPQFKLIKVGDFDEALIYLRNQ